MSSRPSRPPQETDNYFWYCDIQHRLGSGATCSVYLCREKKTGKEYAVKVFNHHGTARPSNVSQRELGLLEKLKECKHENIVRIIAIEKEVYSDGYAIIMEHCVGSLHSLLEKPENAFGFEEEDFNQVVHDVVSGLKYLHDQGIIHRDIKPGNILCFIKDDGSPIYKLTDFGAARELAPEQKYSSIYGTEEYLHPEIFESYYNKDRSKQFGAYADLWSFGVTLYHVATGKLPFRPFERKDQKTMFEIMTKKAGAMISGIQKNRNGSIEWSDKLPENTRLSSGLKEHLVKLLLRLLERDETKRMTFEDLFQIMQDFLAMKIIPVYSARSGTFHTIYANPTDNFARFQELIAIQTGISARQQDLFYNNDVFKPANSMATVSTYPNITKEKPIIVLGGDITSSESLYGQGLLKEIKFNHEVSVTNLDVDYSVSKMATNQMHWSLYIARNLERSIKLTMEAAESVVTLLKRKARKYLNDAQTIENHCNSMVMKHETCINGCEFEMKVLQTLGDEGDIPQEIVDEKEHLVKETKDMREKVIKLQKDMAEPLEKLRNKSHNLISNKGELEEKWDNMCKDTCNENYAGVVENFCGKVTKITENFLDRRRFSDRLTTHDIQNQMFERFRVREYVVKAKEAMEACQKGAQVIHNDLRTWLEEVYDCRRNLKKLREEVNSYIEMFELVMKSEEKWRSDHMARMETILKDVRGQVRRAITVNERTRRSEVGDMVDGEESPPSSDITEDMARRITTVLEDTKEAKLMLHDNTTQFQKFVKDLIEELDKRKEIDISLE